ICTARSIVEANRPTRTRSPCGQARYTRRMIAGRILLVCLLGTLACSSPPTPTPPAKPEKRAGAVTISIVGTNDLHGAIGRLPILAGYVANLRDARKADGGGVLLVDAGDMFQ